MNIAPPPGRIPVVLVTGFLGSGKTTLLARLLRRPELARSAVIINEFGAVGLDHDLIERADDDVVELAGGCVCCSQRGELGQTLARLRERREAGSVAAFERVLIETTGLADPAPILRDFLADAWLADTYRFDGVITTVDAVHGLDTLERQPEARAQAAFADRLLLTKVDVAPPAAIDALRERLAALNPGVAPLAVAAGEIAPDALFGAAVRDPRATREQVERWLGARGFVGWRIAASEPDRHGPDIRAQVLVREAPLPAAVFRGFFDLLLEARRDDLLRVKGLVNIAGAPGPLLVHGVQGSFEPLLPLAGWPGDDRRTRLVFITRGISGAWIEGLLRSLE